MHAFGRAGGHATAVADLSSAYALFAGGAVRGNLPEGAGFHGGRPVYSRPVPAGCRQVAPMSRNLLSEETSPYLLQHADNPVHWRGWGPEALAEAKASDRPVLLSVGYAACHWCHVMAHECFENVEIATLMNDHFVNVKVDREERPDIDTIYQHALQVTGQQGGWPLTMFLTPDGTPFWGGTYFPPAPAFGRPGFPQILRAVSDLWKGQREKALQAAAGLDRELRRIWEPAANDAGGGFLSLDVNDRAAERLAREFDMVHGGFGRAPKFPNPSIHELLWRVHLRTGDGTLRDAVLLSLTKMCQGGIYDHLGGGFARYSTDDRWLVPHFEKMLYDNAQIVDLLVSAWQTTRSPLFAQRAAETLEWTLREMTAPGGDDGAAGFAASYDADSEGREGLFYVWSADEIDALLREDAELFRTVYDVTPEGNWEGASILNRTARPDPLDDAGEARLAAARETLREARAARVPPGWDDKVLADWNGLMIAAMARAAMVFDRPRWLAAARGAFDFVRDRMSRDGRLGHSWRAGVLKHAATLDDHANMARAALALFEATGAAAYADAARAWTETVEARYRDKANGGYFFTADDAEALLVRTRSAADNATPAGNATMADVLIRLHHLTGERVFLERAETLFRAFAGETLNNVFGSASLLCASELVHRFVQVVIAGPPDDPVTKALATVAWRTPGAGRLVVPVHGGARLPDGHVAAGKGPLDGRPAAYVCAGRTCSLPVAEPAELQALLERPWVS